MQYDIFERSMQRELAALSLEAVTTRAATNIGGGASAAQSLAIGQQLIQQLRNTKPVGGLPKSHVFRADLSREDYVAKSGGTTQKADVHANGDVVSGGRTGWFRRSRAVDIRPGDTIALPLNTERVAALPLSTSVTTIIYNLAIAILAIRSVSP